MQKAYRHFRSDDLVRLETYLELNMNYQQIAIKLGRNRSTIYRCVKKNQQKDGRFCAQSAWEKISERKKSAHSGASRIESSPMLEAFVLEKMALKWSPEQIAGRWKQSHVGEPLSPQTVYGFVRRYHPEKVQMWFRRKGKKYRKKGDPKRPGPIVDGRSIHDRPAEIEDRKTVGHWEGDTIIGKNHKGAIATNVERKSGFLMARKVDQKRAELMADVTKEMFDELPDSLKISITYDQGSEFAWHKVIEAENDLVVYFADAGSPWQRGSNENTNGLIRDFLPKGTSFEDLSDAEVAHIVDLLNDRPRKRLGFLTPREFLSSQFVALDSDV